MIASVISGIWADNGKVKCPICAAPMDKIGDYEWLCVVAHCPFNTAEFTEAVHSYGVAENSPKDKRDGTVF